jgi:hypothetical protein
LPTDETEADPNVVARTVLTKREDADIERIQKSAEALAGDSPEIVEAAERVRSVRGPDEVHTRAFRIGAIADLMEAIVDTKPEIIPEAKPQAKRQANARAKPQASKKK